MKTYFAEPPILYKRREQKIFRGYNNPIPVPYVVGLALASLVAVLTRFVGLDRDRAFYPTVMVVIASYKCFADIVV